MFMTFPGIRLSSLVSSSLEPNSIQSGNQSHTWTLNVTDDATGSVVHELDADLGDTTAGACSC